MLGCWDVGMVGWWDGGTTPRATDHGLIQFRMRVCTRIRVRAVLYLEALVKVAPRVKELG